MENKVHAWIYAQLEEKNWSQRRLAIEAGMSPTHLTNVLSGERNLTFDVCYKIANALGEAPEHVMRLAGLLPPKPGGNIVTNRIGDIIKGLPVDRQKELLSYVKFLEQQEQQKKNDARHREPVY